MSDAEESRAIEAQQAAIDVTRQRLALEVNELAERLKPAAVKQRAEARVRASLWAMIESLRRRPLLTAAAAGLLAAGVGLSLWKHRRRAHALAAR